MSTSKIQNVALLGASGKLGGFILEALTRETSFTTTIIARESSTMATYDAAIKVHRVSDAYTEAEMVAAFQGQDAVIVALSHAVNAEHHRKFMDAAAEAKVKHFIPNHWGSNAELPIVRNGSDRSQSLDTDVEYLRTKESLGMSWTAIIPGIFFDLAFKYGLLGFNLSDKKAQIWDQGDSTFSASTNSDIATATLAVLLNPQRSQNKYVYTSSFETSQNQLLAVVEDVTHSKWEIEHVTTAEKVEQAQKTIAGGASGMLWMMAQGTLAAAALFGGEQYQADFVASGRSSNAALDLKQRDVKETIKGFL